VKPIVCPTDFSESALAARHEAARLARALGAEIVLVHVATEDVQWREGRFSAPLAPVFEAQRKWAADALADQVSALAADGIAARSVVRVGVPWEEILHSASEEDAQMIVMGTLGRTGLERIMLGSVAERVVRRAPCPVLTIRPRVSTKGETS
jgi:nucleotide-binding universal stress UspA family protein